MTGEQTLFGVTVATTVVHLKRDASWTVRIDRQTRWGNPFRVDVHGTRTEVIAAYRQWLWQQIKDKTISLEELAGLHGEVLGCWCKPKACHGDVLARAADWAYSQLNGGLE